MITRRHLLQSGPVVAGLVVAAQAGARVPDAHPRNPHAGPLVVTPNGTTLPSALVDGVRVMHLVAEPVKHELTPGLVIDAWGYNGRTPGPTIECTEGERLRIY